MVYERALQLMLACVEQLHELAVLVWTLRLQPLTLVNPRYNLVVVAERHFYKMRILACHDFACMPYRAVRETYQSLKVCEIAPPLQ